MRSFVVTAALLLLLSVSGDLLAVPLHVGILESVDDARHTVTIEGCQYLLAKDVEIYRESRPDLALSPGNLYAGQKVKFYCRDRSGEMPVIGALVISDR